MIATFTNNFNLHYFKQVHGDIRRPNILYGTTFYNDNDRSKQFWLIDFDWAGKDGEVRYPVQLNNKINWHCEVKVGSVIKCAHDLFMLDNITSKIKNLKTMIDSNNEYFTFEEFLTITATNNTDALVPI